jgi:hypothetical protein
MHPLRKQPQPPFPDPWWGYELEGRGGVEDPAGLGVSVRPQDGRDLVLLLGGCPPPRTPPDHLSVRQASAVAAANWYRGPPSPVKSFFGVTFHAPSCRHFGMGNTRSERVRLRGDQQSPRNFRSSKLSSPWERVSWRQPQAACRGRMCFPAISRQWDHRPQRRARFDTEGSQSRSLSKCAFTVLWLGSPSIGDLGGAEGAGEADVTPPPANQTASYDRRRPEEGCRARLRLPLSQ